MTMFFSGLVPFNSDLRSISTVLNAAFESTFASGSGIAPASSPRVILTVGPASGPTPPTSDSISTSVLRPSSWWTPGVLTAPMTDTGWLWNSATLTATSGSWM